MKINNTLKLLLIFILILSGYSKLSAQTADLSKAVIIVSDQIKSPVKETAIRVLQEETAQRTGIQLRVSSKAESPVIIILAKTSDVAVDGIPAPARIGENQPETKAEGFRISLDNSTGKQILWLIGADERGVIFSIGQFLRTATLMKNKINFEKKNEIATAPAYPIRGHQIGYRNTANSWDSWNPKQFEKYFRELALFGTNCFENIPFQDGSFRSAHEITTR